MYCCVHTEQHKCAAMAHNKFIFNVYNPPLDSAKLTQMEFEKAVFRIYEHTIEKFSDRDSPSRPSKYCRLGLFILFAATSFYALELFFIHSTFVGTAGCLPALLMDAGVPHNGKGFKLDADDILSLNLETDIRTSRANGIDLTDGDGTIYLSRNLAFVTPQENGSLAYNISDFEFSRTLAVLALPMSIRSAHGFRTFNITLPTDACFGSNAMQQFLPWDGVDIVMLNELTYTLKTDGTMWSLYGYTSVEKDITESFTPDEWLLFRVEVLISSLFSFFFMSTSTALMIRVLVSSGVVLVFPMLWALQVQYNINKCTNLHIYVYNIYSHMHI